MISTTTKIAVYVLAVLVIVSGAAAQSHFTFASRTGSSATVGIPVAANPNIAGIPLASGDEIGAFSPSGLCVGACVWTGSAAASITVWGDDSMTPAIDGMTGGQAISYRIWDASAAVEYPAVSVSYSMGDGIFQPNGVYIVSSMAANAALPVELSSFKAAAAARGTLLTWTTATETNCFGFDIERSPSGSGEWQKIGFMEGAGTTNAQKRYSFTDRFLPPGKLSYRLKQIDRDGRFVYSPVVDLSTSRIPDDFALEQNFPNPFNPSTTISFDLPKESFIRLTVYDALGEQVATLVNEVRPAGQYTVSFDAAGLSAGIYLYRLDAGTFSRVRRMILLK